MDIPRDFSNEYVINNPDLLKVEKPIPYNEFLYHSKARDKHLEYMILKKITETKTHAEYLFESMENNLHNRYRGVLPYRDTIVNISTGQYINANFIHVSFTNDQSLIAAQGPLSNTASVFWRMIWEHDVNLVIMCCNFIEKDMPKCYNYLSSDSSLLFEEFEISVIKETLKFPKLSKKSILIKNLNLNQTKKITHLHIIDWEDNSVPLVKEGFNTINYTIFMMQHKLRKHSGKVLVHCSAGVGRTGVILVLFELVTNLETQFSTKETPSLSIFGTVRKIREQRWGLVKNPEQYEFIYSFMEYWIAACISANGT
jgi:protein tyrosine phosphatase